MWDEGSKSTLPTFKLPAPRVPLAPPPNSDAGPSRPRTPTEPFQALTLPDEESTADDDAPQTRDGGPSTHVDPLEPSEISTLLTVSLLQALIDLQPSLFPIPASLLYSAHVLPCRPAYIPREKREEVVISRSEWKKLAKWMKEAGKEGLLRIKESKGEVIVQGWVGVRWSWTDGDGSFDAGHPSLESHVPFLTIAEEESKAAKRAAREAAADGGAATSSMAKGKGKEILVEEMWKPAGGAIPFWESAGVE